MGADVVAKFKVVTLSTFSQLFELEADILAKAGGELTAFKPGGEQQLISVLRDADAILTGRTQVTAKIIDSLDKCKIIVRCGIGVDNIDVQAATRRNIIVSNVPDYCIDEVSDHALALILALTRKVLVCTAAVRAGTWVVKTAMPIQRHRGRTLGLVGFGKIPRALAPKAQALGLAVIAADPYVSPDAAAPLGVRMVDFPTLLLESDVVSIHAPLTDETRGLFGDREFGQMKPGAILVNTSRGPLVQQAALVRALESGRLAGAGLDVLEAEPPSRENPLLGMPNVALTPHIAFYSEQSLIDLQRMAAEEVRRALRGETPRNVVNREVLGRARALAASP